MARIHEGTIVVRDAPAQPIGGPGLIIYGLRVDADEVLELRDNLTRWLEEVGRDR